MDWKDSITEADLMFRRQLAQRYLAELERVHNLFLFAKSIHDIEGLAEYGERYGMLYVDAKELELATLEGFLVREDRFLPLKLAEETLSIWSCEE